MVQGMAYKQFNIEEREAIQGMRWEHRSIRYMAKVLGRDPSSISREITRNGTTVYVPRKAQERAEARIQRRGHRPRLKDPRIRRYVERKLRRHWSPEQIAGRLPRAHPGWQTISPESIYQYVYAPFNLYAAPPQNDLRACLKRRHRIRKQKGVCHGNRGCIAGRISIEQRPAEVDERKRIGDWEDDSIVSRQSSHCLNALVERKSGLLKLTKVTDSTAAATAAVVVRRLTEAPKRKRLTMTVDNGHEHADHQEITRATGTKIFFCHPYRSSERGTNENTNGLVREYFPKKTDFALVSVAEVARVERELNCRPRKRLGYLTPLEVFNQRVALKG